MYNEDMFNVNHIVEAGGLLAVAITIFAESGLLLGIFLPGDTLLLTAGLFAGQGKLPLDWLIIISIISAVLGYQVGYFIGERTGPRLFKRKDGLLFREEYIERTQKFLKKYGAATLIIARFIAHIRTLVSAVAGAGKMDKRLYLAYNIIGAILWTSTLTLLGYWLGSRVPNIDRYFFPTVIIGLIIVYLFAAWELGKNPQTRKNLKKGLKEDWDYFFKR
jgi:membrane-associated protein